MVAALYLIKAITEIPTNAEVRLFEGFVSFKESGKKSIHSRDVELLREVVENPYQYPEVIIEPEALRMTSSDILRLAPQHSHMQFFEVDHPATSAAKARGVALEGQPANMIQVAAGLGEQALSSVLSEDGRWQSSLPSVLLAEGLFQYLRDDEVRGLLRDAATCTPPGSRFAFTHAIPGERRMLSILTRLIAEPWKSAVWSEDLPEYVEETGWTMISDVDTDSAHGVERYAVAERR